MSYEPDGGHSRLGRLCILAILTIRACSSQSTEGLISGRVADVTTERAIPGAAVTCTNAATHTSRTAKADADGIYVLPLLPPGSYAITVSRDGYQTREQDDMQLGVAESLALNFTLRPLPDIWESVMQHSMLLPQSSALLNFHGPDLDPNHWTTFSTNPGSSGKLEASISTVVSPADVRELPLDGENIFAVLLAEPGVTANVAASRSLGIAANGQRPSSSNFLLDGVEANFYLVSGPVLTIAPEATQEYRLSTNNFSAEFGRTAGYIANAVTRSGGDTWHGQAYFDLENTVLNANDFQFNLAGLPRTPMKQDRVGGFAGGPIWNHRLFSGTSLQYFRSRSQAEPQSFYLPSTTFYSGLGCPNPVLYACQLLVHYPIPRSTADTGPVTLAQPVTVNQWLASQRFDYAAPKGSQHATVRFATANLTRPDFIWSPYPDYISGLDQPVYNLAVNWVWTARPSLTNELSGGWSDQRISWARAHPEVPTLTVISSGSSTPLLPGSPAAYGLNNSSRTFQIDDSVTALQGRHIMKAGGGGLWRRTNDFLGYGLDGEYSFCSLIHFGRNLTSGCPDNNGTTTSSIQFTGALARGASSPTPPDFARAYQSRQLYFFAQDTFRVTSRLVLNFGLRYDYFGAPSYARGAKDWTVQFGTGSNFDQRLANATLAPPSAAQSSLFSAATGGLAPRVGLAYDLFPSGRATLRGGFGLFYDRLFDNLWLDARNNSFIFPSNPAGVPTYLPAASALAYFGNRNTIDEFPNLTAFQPNLHAGYAEDFFLGIQTHPTTAWSLDINGAGSLGRKLVTNDVINNNQTVNESLPAIDYLSNQGLSDYYSLSIVNRWRASHGFLQAAYTWSHAIDLQSDPLAGDFFNLEFANSGLPGSSVTASNMAAFATPYDSRGDRGSADFDQRHALVFYSWWRIPRGGRSLLRRIVSGFAFSQMAAIRSGFPYSVFGAISGTTLDLNEAYVRPYEAAHALLAPREPVPGGEQLFTASAFCQNNTCPLPPLGRNAFTGPGLINLDVSTSRAFYLRWLGEAGTLTVRADAFNFLNHANLNPPANTPGSPNYGVALFGAPANTTGFPSVIPLSQTSRRVQLMVRVTF